MQTGLEGWFLREAESLKMIGKKEIAIKVCIE